MAFNQISQFNVGSSRNEGEFSGSSQDGEGPGFLSHVAMNDKIDELVYFLLQKYKRKELASRAMMLHSFMKDYPEHFAAVFHKVCQCLYVIFGIDVQEVCPPGHIYVLVPVLGLTYNMRVADDCKLAKTGLLIMIITTILRKHNRASERAMWLALNRMELFDGREHFIYGDPRKFMTGELVREGYLVYRQVPNSDPIQYEFLWGPRTHAETTKMRVLEHLARVNNRDPWSFPRLYEEALSEEIEATRARRALRATEGASCRPGVCYAPNPHH